MNNSDATPDAVSAMLTEHLANYRSSFSIGGFGAVGEFFRDRDEPFTLVSERSATVVTERGAIRVTPNLPMRPVAYEIASARKGAWMHGVVCCVRENDAIPGNEAPGTIAELGLDDDAIRECDRGDRLFDLGAGLQNCRFCIRTKEPGLVQSLRAVEGQNLFDSGAALAGIMDANPHRVVISALGRVEVYQTIGRERTPEGPHTHLLPKLLRSRRSHDANVPVPPGWVPGLTIYPESPLFDALGQSKRYDGNAHRRFQQLLHQWGLSDYVEQKNRVRECVQDRRDPNTAQPKTRLARVATKVMLRQLQREEPESETVDIWSRHYDAA